MDPTRLWCWVWSRLHPGDDGAALVEYALLVALIAVVCLVAVTTLGGNASAKYSGVASSLS
jgi:pilus assembly protein Flp/PilA